MVGVNRPVWIKVVGGGEIMHLKLLTIKVVMEVDGRYRAHIFGYTNIRSKKTFGGSRAAKRAGLQIARISLIEMQEQINLTIAEVKHERILC